MPLRLRFARRTTLYFFPSIGEDAAARRRGAPDRRPLAVDRIACDFGRLVSFLHELARCARSFAEALLSVQKKSGTGPAVTCRCPPGDMKSRPRAKPSWRCDRAAEITWDAIDRVGASRPIARVELCNRGAMPQCLDWHRKATGRCGNARGGAGPLARLLDTVRTSARCDGDRSGVTHGWNCPRTPP